MGRDRELPVALAAGLVLAACSVDRSGLGQNDPDGGLDASADAAGSDAARDGRHMDAPADAVADADAGPLGCPERSWPRPRAALTGSEPGEGFLDPAASHETTIVEDERLVLPLAGYRWGALVFGGTSDSDLLDTPFAWSDVEGVTPEGRAFIGDLDRSYSGASAPPSLLIDGQDSYTVMAEGEVFLEAGMRQIALSVDDRGVLEVDLDPDDDSAGLRRVVAPDAGTPGRMMFEVAAEGWYPIRFAYTDDGGDSALVVREGPADGSLEVIPPDRLRAHAGWLAGRESLGFAERTLSATPDGTRIDPDPTDVDYGNIALPGLSLGDKDDFIVRWQGRLRFGAMLSRLHADTDDSHRVWVDGVYLGGAYDNGSMDREYPYALESGWHDTVVELGDEGGGTEQHVYWDGAPFEAADMRPHVRFGGLVFGRGTNGEFDVDAGMSTMRALDVAAPARTPTAVELSAVVRTEDPSSVSVSVTAPDDTTFDLTAEPRPLPFARAFAWHRAVPGSELGAAADGEWSVTIDNAGDETVTVRGAGVLAHIGGNEQPYPATGTFVSAPLELGGAVQVDRIEALGRVPDGTAVGLAVRVADSEAGLAEAPWVDADASGTVPAGHGGQWAQIRVVLEGGVDTPRIRKLRLRGSTCLCAPGTAPEECVPPLEDPGLVALYTFDDGSGETVTDEGPGDPMNLTIEDTSLVSWDDGTLTIDEPTKVFTDDATKIAGSVTDAVTVEAWVRPARRTVVGDLPKRVVTFSKDSGERNFTIGQDERWRWVVRLRTNGDGGDDNGEPEMWSPVASVRTELVHVVFTHSTEAGGTARVYLDGELAHEEERAGDLTNWNPDYGFGLANEADDGRAWLGTYHRVVVYSRALDEAEVRAQTDRGP